MVTTQSYEDDFDEVERGIDWLERLENIKARQDREAALREAVEYVNRLRDALAALSGDEAIDLIAERHGKDVADIVGSVRADSESDPWLIYLRPALLER